MPTAEEFLAAVKAGDADAVAAAAAADPQLAFARDNNGVSALMLAVYHQKPGVAQAIIAARGGASGSRGNGAAASHARTLDLFEATATGHCERMNELLREDPPAVNSYSSDGWTPLHLAAAFNQPQCAEALVAQGADVNARSRNQMNNMPLHACAALSRSVAIAFLLLEKGASVNAQQHGGFTALHAAAFHGDIKMAELLLSKGARADVTTDSGQAALDLALGKAHQEMVDLLRARGGEKP